MTSTSAREHRVLQVVLSLDPGGTERLVVELASRLHDEMPTRVCCLDRRGLWADDLEARGIVVETVGRKPGFRPSAARAVAAAARRHRATVIHAHHYSPFVYSGLARLWGPRTAVVFTEHGRLSEAPPSPKRRAANRLLKRLPQRVFTVSEHLKAHLVAEGFDADAVRVIYNGIAVDPLPDPAQRADVRHILGAGPGGFVVGTIARLDPVKDLGTLIQAVGAARALAGASNNWSLVIIGDGPERDGLEQAARAHGVSEQLRFLGHRNDARRWLSGCDAYVNCSTSEGISLTILEAMAAGLPVVATAVGGTPEILDESCARLVPPRDVAALTAALAALARRPTEARRLGESARRRVESAFTIERMVRQYRDVYLESA